VTTPVALAMSLAATGYHVYPLGRSKRPVGACLECSSGCDGWQACECPWPCHGVRSATTEAVRIMTWAHRWQRVGIATEPSGIAVVDVETEGREWMNERVTDGRLPRTWWTPTASGGWHLYYRETVPTRTHQGMGAPVDVKSEGSGVVAYGIPPAAADLTAAPSWLRVREEAPRMPQLAAARPFAGAERDGCRHAREYVATGVRMAVDHIEQHTERGAGTALYSRARAIASKHRDCVGPCGLTEVAETLTAAAVSVGVPEEYALRQVERAGLMTLHA
jgi:hypothetical protein